MLEVHAKAGRVETPGPLSHVPSPSPSAVHSAVYSAVPASLNVTRSGVTPSSMDPGVALSGASGIDSSVVHAAIASAAMASVDAVGVRRARVVMFIAQTYSVAHPESTPSHSNGRPWLPGFIRFTCYFSWSTTR